MVNIEEFPKLDLGITLYQQCQKQEVNILMIKDDGPGMNHRDLKEALTGELQSSKKKQGGFNSAENA